MSEHYSEKFSLGYLSDYTVSDLLNTLLTLDEQNIKLLLDYYELLSLRRDYNAQKLAQKQGAS